MWVLCHRLAEVRQVTGVAVVGNGCPNDQLEPGGIQELTHSRIKDLTSGHRGLPSGDRLVSRDGNNFPSLILVC